MEEIAANGGVLIACNKKSLPVGMFVPLAAHHRSHQRLDWQINADVPCQKRSWMKIVKAKIKAQGRLLQKRFQSDFGLTAMAQRVKSGDTTNLEAQAARRYRKEVVTKIIPMIRRFDSNNPNAKFLFSLKNGETFKVLDNGKEKLVILKRSASTSGQIFFIDVRDARKTPKDISKQGDTLNDIIEKVCVDQLDNVQAGD
ncbi:hypothetical protein FACS189443_2880 [Planctomycetales bacterium]|nr:hypothetical protein FACS189443_2880 [Planctomycetales bacterium]